MRKILMFILIFIITGMLLTTGFAQTPEESLKKSFPKLKIDSIQPSTIKGIYEVVTNNKIIYYSSEADSLIVGEIITKEGQNLTSQRQQALLSGEITKKFKDIPLQKAISIGKGKHIVIEITDPDCPYCRRASEFLSKRTDLTRHIFFYPLPMHPKSADKVLYIFCAKDKAQAYEDAMTGKLDDMTFKPCEDPQARERLKDHKNVVDLLEVRGTPFFFVDGKTAVFGADIPQLERLLRDGK